MKQRICAACMPALRVLLSHGSAGLPAWPAFTPENGATMVVDNKRAIRNHHHRDLLAAISQ